MQEEAVEQLWQLVYESFNRTNEVFKMPAVVGSSQPSRQVGRRLLNNIAKLKANSKDAEVLDRVQADILLSESMEWIPTDTSKAMQQLLAKLGV